MNVSPRPSPSTAARLARPIVALLAALGFITGVAALPAQAGSSPSYVGLGDSIAAGTGGSTVTNVLCQQTTVAYPVQLGGTDLGCFGAMTSDVVNTQVPQLPSSTRNVTITVGANDAGAGAAVVSCFFGTATQCDQTLLYSTTVLIPELPAKLSATIAAVRAKDPTARITLTGYPLLFTVSGLPAAQRQAAASVNAATLLLNATIATTAWRNGAGYADVTFRFLGHGVGSQDPWINGPILTPTGLAPGSYHPNDSGYTHGYVPAVAPFIQQGDN
ncbi:GDSL-type esterase/lipase family protein [Sinomonas terrae]|uniref:GDSL-type esterase/lipase family protein n=1 Tax=Sinomonas terrae TaxID=2908838 RepID=A0ABS9TXG8_9MICC|nr:GDSL-type esterase/lipase family protein [Sinomonas terrae]MCH6469126.1 GDSL-type esterase/lipase family protein [Sinomonas terrae]